MSKWHDFLDGVERKQDLDTLLAELTTDLKLIKPMNRVICGDVGFGKTEVAMRATNLVAYNQKQIIISNYVSKFLINGAKMLDKCVKSKN